MGCVEIALTSLIQFLSGRLLRYGFNGSVKMALLELVKLLRSRMLYDGVGGGVLVPFVD